MPLQKESLKIATKDNLCGNKLNQKGNSKYLHLKIQQNQKPELSTLYRLSICYHVKIKTACS